MRNYITQLSKEDFLILHPEFPFSEESSFPKVVALISDQYPSLPNHTISPIQLHSVVHIYSTRDYWEVSIHGEDKRQKIPKRYTKAIYLIEED